MIDLNQHGSASRCLLRLRENLGEPVISDHDFIQKYRGRFPHWEMRPGELSTADLLVLARELKLAAAIELTGDYDRLVQEFDAGHDILVLTERAPVQRSEAGHRPHHTTSLVVAMDLAGLTLWWPDPTGQSEVLPRADRTWWYRWQALGLVLRHPSPPVAGAISDHDGRKESA